MEDCLGHRALLTPPLIDDRAPREGNGNDNRQDGRAQLLLVGDSLVKRSSDAGSREKVDTTHERVLEGAGYCRCCFSEYFASACGM